MKHFVLIAFLLFAFAAAQAQSDTTFYSTAAAAANGLRKVRTKYRAEDGRQYPVAYDPANLATYYIAHNCQRGYFRVMLDKGTTASAD